MADFSINATQLAEPQGAGAKVVSPVQSMDTGPNPLNSIFGNVVDIFAKGLASNQKAEAEAQKSQIVGQFVKEQTRINQSVRTGQMSAAEADVHYRANFSAFAERNPAYIEDIRKASDALKGASEQGNVDTELRMQREERRKDIADAIKDGAIIEDGMSEMAVNSALKNWRLKVSNRKALDDTIKQNTEARTQDSFDRSRAEAELGEKARAGVNMIVGSELENYRVYADDIAMRVGKGTLDLAAGQQMIAKYLGNIEATLVATGQGKQNEMVSAYKKVFSEYGDVLIKSLDPKTKAENYKAKLDGLVSQTILFAAERNPEVLGAIALNRSFPNSAEAATKTIGAAAKALALYSSFPVNAPGAPYMPTVVGDPETEPKVLEFVKQSVRDLVKTKGTDKERILIEQSNSANHILKQVGDLSGKGIPADSLVGVAKFFASPEFLTLKTSGQIDQSVAGFAKNVIERQYTEAVEKDAQVKLKTILYDRQRTYKQSLSNSFKEADSAAPKALNDYVDINFNGAVVAFTPKGIDSLSPMQRQAVMDGIDSLRGTSAALTQLVKMEGNLREKTDYKAVWEEKRASWFPDRFKAPEAEKPVAKAGSEEQIIKAALGDIGNVKLSQQELSEIQAALKESLKRTDLTPEARKSIERSLGKY